MEKPITWGAYFLEDLEHFLAQYGIDPHPGIDALVVSVILILFAYFAGRKYRKSEMVEPEGRVTLAFVGEFIITILLSIFESILDRKARKYFFILATFAFFILGNNLIGSVPGFNPPTDQLNVTVVLALMTFFTAHFIGIRAHKAHYIQKFMGPLWWLTPLMLPIELISHMVRPLSLAIRLYGNISGDHKVAAVFSSLVAFGLPVPFMGLGIFVAFLQTYIFVLLSSIYFQDALDHPH